MQVDAHTSGLRLVAADNDTILNLDPIQGLWTEQQYLLISSRSRRLLKYADGSLEMLPAPTDKYQFISRFLLFDLFPLVQRLGGTVLYAPLRLRIREGKFREPDLLLVPDDADPRRRNAYWLGADLVVEIVIPDDSERDTKVKRAEYAEVGIAEYWIVDPEGETFTVPYLADTSYVEHEVFHRGDVATSPLLPDLAIQTTDLFDAH